METRTDRAESRKTVDLVKQFIDAAFKYRFLYVQNRTDGAHRVDAVQRAVLDSIQKAHTKAQTLLRSIEACGLPASESHDAWRLLSIGLPDASYADCERALKNWARPVAAKPVGPVGRKPRAKRRVTSKPLTKAQTEAMAAYMGCGQNVGAVAAELKISRGAAYDRINAALQKTGQKPLPKRAARSVRAIALRADNRGQYTVDSDD